MATIKSFTSLEQSKKLAEILPLESADMFYDGVQDLYKEKVYNIPINGSSITVRTGHIITEKELKQIFFYLIGVCRHCLVFCQKDIHLFLQKSF